jgi:branched-chain amino acid aminotransferase
MTGRIYYVNGNYVAAEEAALPLTDLSILRGYGVFDLLRTYAGVPFRLGAHLERLARSAQAIGLEIPWSLAELDVLARETYARNTIADATIRLVVTGGVSENFMMPHHAPSLAIMIDPVVLYPPVIYNEGAVVATTQIPRVMAQVKSLNYIGAIMAMQAAKASSAVEAIYRDSQDRLTEGTRANLFLVRDGIVYTPHEDILFGITRQAVLDAAVGAIEIVEGPVTIEDVRGADELFLTSTTKEILPIRQLDEIVIGEGRPGPVTQQLAERFRALVAAETTPVLA